MHQNTEWGDSGSEETDLGGVESDDTELDEIEARIAELEAAEREGNDLADNDVGGAEPDNEAENNPGGNTVPSTPQMSLPRDFEV